MQYTRKQIIDYLKRHNTASVPELSQALSLTLSNIRHHIHELESQEILEQVGTQKPSGRGRPTLRYSLAIHSLEHNLVSLTSALLKYATRDRNETQCLDIFLGIAKQMTAQENQPRSPTQQVHLAIQWLNRHHYQAHWEASATGPRITLAHCPYLALLPNFPNLCQLDIAIVSRLNNRPMTLSNHQDEQPNHPNPCIFTPQIPVSVEQARI